MTRRELLDNLWRWKCGFPELQGKKTDHIIDIADLYITEWCNDFEKMMRNRRVLGAIRYGKTNAPGKPKYDRVNTMRKKIDLYENTGNKEILVDLANYAMVEFQEPTLDIQTYFEVTDDVNHDIIK